MLANVKNILVGTSNELAEQENSAAFAYALSLAKTAEARLTLQAASVKIALTSAHVSKFAAGLVATENKRLKGLAALAAENARGAADLAGVPCVIESPHMAYGDLVHAFVQQARVHDLTVLDAEPVTVSVDRGLIESAIFDSGRPVLLVPTGIETFQLRRVIICWDGSATAARALNDALPLLRAAEEVEIVSVTGEKDLTTSVPGAEVAPHLAAHSITATVVDLVAKDGDVAEVIRRHAKNTRADLVVMGAYAHSWIRHIVLGGVTQSMLKVCPAPLFLSH